jgi:hypothetical protein
MISIMAAVLGLGPRMGLELPCAVSDVPDELNAP